MAEYLDTEHTRDLKARQAGFTARTEWPTWLLIAAIHGGWLGVVLLAHEGRLSIEAATPPLIVLCTWHLSLQHELLHGHPTRSALTNELLGSVPLSIWYPYTIYRDAHLAHHHEESLTEPEVDPESNYLLRRQWENLPGWQRAIWRARKSFIGRLVVGPPLSIVTQFTGTIREWRRGSQRYAGTWAAHVTLVTAMLVWLQWYAGIPWWYYLLAVAWPALSVAMIRSLYEHRAARDPKHRTAINEAGFLMRLLFLNNNYHLVHHDMPGLPWYHLSYAYRTRSKAYAARNGGFVIRGGYWELFRRYAWRETDDPVLPQSINVPAEPMHDLERVR
jgi:fatty acid desaturase